MKTIQEIEKEYESYQTKTDFVPDLENFIVFLDIGIDDLTESEKDVTTEMHENTKWKFGAFFRNLLPFVFEEEDLEFYDQDNSILLEGLRMIVLQREYLGAIKDIATEKNFGELLRLVDFATDYFNDHISYVETERDVLEMQLKGYTMVNSRYQDNREPFNEFMMKKLSELTPHKVVEKKKKI